MHDIAVHLNADEIDIRSALLHQASQLRIEAGQGRSDRMASVHFVNHPGDVVDRVEYARILEKQVGLVADHPRQKCRMILVLHHFAARVFELLRDGPLIVVVEAVALAADLDAHDDRHAVAFGLVQDLPGSREAAVGSPGAERIAAVRGKVSDIGKFDARAPDRVRFPAAQQRVAAVPQDDFHGYRTAVRLRIRDRVQVGGSTLIAGRNLTVHWLTAHRLSVTNRRRLTRRREYKQGKHHGNPDQ